jgi:hypothetical protein
MADFRKARPASVSGEPEGILQDEINRLQQARADALRARISELEADKFSCEQEIVDLRTRIEKSQEQLVLLGQESGRQAAICEQLKIERDQACQDLERLKTQTTLGRGSPVHLGFSSDSQRPAQLSPGFSEPRSSRRVSESSPADARAVEMETAFQALLRQRDEAIDANRQMDASHRQEAHALAARLLETQQAAERAARDMHRSATMPSAREARNDPSAMATLLIARQRETDFYRAAMMSAMSIVRQAAGDSGSACSTQARRFESVLATPLITTEYWTKAQWMNTKSSRRDGRNATLEMYECLLSSQCRVCGFMSTILSDQQHGFILASAVT